MWKLTYDAEEIEKILFRHWEHVPYPESKRRLSEMPLDSVKVLIGTSEQSEVRFFAAVDDLDRLQEAAASWALFMEELPVKVFPAEKYPPGTYGFAEMGLFLPKSGARKVSGADDAATGQDSTE